MSRYYVIGFDADNNVLELSRELHEAAAQIECDRMVKRYGFDCTPDGYTRMVMYLTEGQLIETLVNADLGHWYNEWKSLRRVCTLEMIGVR